MTFPTRALSIRQPWCHHILFDGKDIENRDWQTSYRGPVLIHASAAFDGYAAERREFQAMHPQSHLGGIVGMVEITDCVSSSESKWFYGQYGFALRNPVPLDFIPCKGALGFFTPVFNRALLQVRKEAA
ncbi:MAG: ASCH domain-containing protein [Pseudomonadota bacterium]|nr:ASCH domain-containing protein [Pseudomonadota bacterium]